MKNNLFHVLPPLYVQNKNGSRDCIHSSFEPNLFAHYCVPSSRVANRCGSNNDCLCTEMSSYHAVKIIFLFEKRIVNSLHKYAKN